jgi:hypothetical protein
MNTYPQHRLGFEALEARRLLAVEVLLTGDGEVLDLPTTQLTGVSKIDICGCGDNSVILNAEWIENSCPDDCIRVVSNTGDHIELTDSGWRFEKAHVEQTFIVREFKNGEAILQLIGPDDLTNPIDAADVSGNGEASALDVLLIINELSARRFSNPEDGSLIDPEAMPLERFRFYDVSGNGAISALDALRAINAIYRDDLSTSAATALVPIDLTATEVLASDPVIAAVTSSHEVVDNVDDGNAQQIGANGVDFQPSPLSEVSVQPSLSVGTQHEPASGLDTSSVDALMLETTLGFCVGQACLA